MHAYIKEKTELSSPTVSIQYNYLVQAAKYSALPEETAARLHDRGHAADKHVGYAFPLKKILPAGGFVQECS